MNRKTVAGLVLLIWGGALGWLAARQIGQSSRPSLTADRTISPSAAFYAVRRGDVQIGFASATVDTIPTGLVVDDRTVLELPVGDTVIRSDVRTIANLTNTMALETFTTSAGASVGRFDIRGTAMGDTAIAVSVVTEADAYEYQLQTGGPVLLTSHVPVHLSSTNRLVNGTNLDLTVLDPVTMILDTVAISVAEDSVFLVPDSASYDQPGETWVEARMDTVQAWRVTATARGASTESWIDALGRVVSRRSETGPRLDRTAFEIAFNNFRARGPLNSPGSVALGTAIAAGRTTAPGLDSLRLTIRGLPAAYDPGESLRHQWSGDTLTVIVDPDSALETSGRLPYRDEAYQRYLDDALPYNWNDPYLQAQARLAVDGTRNHRRAAQRLTEWVSNELQKVAVPSVPAATVILNARRGDAADHATLFVAMARVVGLPARPVAGVILMDGTFYLHAWAEVFLGKHWVAADPTFGQFPAGAEYVRLVESSGSLIDLIGQLSQLDIDVVETRE